MGLLDGLLGGLVGGEISSVVSGWIEKHGGSGCTSPKIGNNGFAMRSRFSRREINR
jgi:hypothetical protein